MRLLDWGQSCSKRQLTNSNLKTGVSIARFRVIRARFNKRATQAFPKTDRRSDICDAPLSNSNIDEICCVCMEAAALTEDNQ